MVWTATGIEAPHAIKTSSNPWSTGMCVMGKFHVNDRRLLLKARTYTYQKSHLRHNKLLSTLPPLVQLHQHLNPTDTSAQRRQQQAAIVYLPVTALSAPSAPLTWPLISSYITGKPSRTTLHVLSQHDIITSSFMLSTVKHPTNHRVRGSSRFEAHHFTATSFIVSRTPLLW